MTVCVAGHTFNAIVPGEYCLNSSTCKGVRSLTELLRMADSIEVGDQGIAHIGCLTQTEINTVKQAKITMDIHIERVMGFR